MPRSKTKDITDRFKKMRKCKIIELCKSPELDLTDEEITPADESDQVTDQPTDQVVDKLSPVDTVNDTVSEIEK